jgi:hypothetical protein
MLLQSSGIPRRRAVRVSQFVVFGVLERRRVLRGEPTGDQPTTRRLHTSTTTAKYKNPACVGT